MRGIIRRRMRSEKGFTLIELLVVIIIIAILAAIAIPTFLGQRTKAQDTASRTLVRNAMTTLETAYTDTQTFATLVAADLSAIEPSIAWPVKGAAGVCSAPAATSLTRSNIVSWATPSATSYEIGTWSESGKEFGVLVNKNAARVFYKGGANFAGTGAAVAAGGVW